MADSDWAVEHEMDDEATFVVEPGSARRCGWSTCAPRAPSAQTGAQCLTTIGNGAR